MVGGGTAERLGGGGLRTFCSPGAGGWGGAVVCVGAAVVSAGLVWVETSLAVAGTVALSLVLVRLLLLPFLPPLLPPLLVPRVFEETFPSVSVAPSPLSALFRGTFHVLFPSHPYAL